MAEFNLARMADGRSQNDQPLKHILSIRIFDIFLEKFIFCFLHCYLIPFSVKVSHVMIGNLTNLIFINIHHQFPQR